MLEHSSFCLFGTVKGGIIEGRKPRSVGSTPRPLASKPKRSAHMRNTTILPDFRAPRISRFVDASACECAA